MQTSYDLRENLFDLVDLTFASPEIERWLEIDTLRSKNYSIFSILLDPDVKILIDPFTGHKPTWPILIPHAFELNKSQVSYSSLEDLLPFLIEGSLDSKYYSRFIIEGSPSIHTYLLEKLPSDHPIVKQIQANRKVHLRNNNFNLDLLK